MALDGPVDRLRQVLKPGRIPADGLLDESWSGQGGALVGVAALAGQDQVGQSVEPMRLHGSTWSAAPDFPTLAPQ